MCMMRSAFYRLFLVTLFALLFVCANSVVTVAQTATANDACANAINEYASWLDKLESLRGTLTFSGTENDRGSLGNVTFGIVNTGDLERLDYFIQAQFTRLYQGAPDRSEFVVYLVKDNFAAGLDYRGPGWDVVEREEAYDLRDIEDGFFRADEFLKTAFKELRLLELSACLGSETIAGRETTHYKLDVPPMLARMLASQLAGNVPDDVVFGEVGFDFWLDKTDAYILFVR